MYKKWKSVAALGMAVLIGCMMPVSTMMAAEEDPEAAKEIEMDSVSDEEAILEDENAGDEENVNEDVNENTGDEVNVDEDENADDENVDDEVNSDNGDIAVMAETEGSEAGDTETQANTAAPVIKITLSGNDYTRSLGGEIAYQYVNNHDQVFECSVDQENAKLSYYLDEANDTAAKEAEKINWPEEVSSSSIKVPLSADKSYVLYVKAVGAGGETTYARSEGIVVDTTPPVVSPLLAGKTYAEGTPFWIRDDHLDLDSVTVNEKHVTPAPGGSYQVSANGTSCVIKAKDKAGNEMTCSINVSGSPADNIISESGIYSLKEKTPYQLAAGQWQVSGDKSVYLGGITFYVKADGNYIFTKR